MESNQGSAYGRVVLLLKSHDERCCVVIKKMAFLAVLFALSLRAELVCYFPFDNGTVASLTNFGTYGGTAIPTNKYNVTYNPVALATNTPLRTPFVERFPIAGSAEGGYLTLPNSADKLRFIGADSNPTGALTVSTWVNWKGHGVLASHIDSCILSTMEGNMNSGFRLFLSQGGEVTFVFCRTPNNHNGSSGFSIPSNEWVHVTLRWKASYPQVSQVSTNGIFSAKNNWSGSGTTATNASSLRIGAMDSVNGYRPLNGLLDELAVWDEYLSDAQVKTLYSVPTNLTTSNEVYTVSAIASLWALHSTSNTTPTVVVGKRTWKYAATLPAGHTAGESWLNSATQKAYIQLGASTGLEGLPPPPGTLIRVY